MVRTSILADEQTLDRLRALARERGVSLGAVIREALDEKAAEPRPRPLSAGIGASGGSHVAATAATEPVPPAPWR